MPEQATKAQRLKTQLMQCHGFDGDEISKGRESALDYYFQRARDDEVVGRSDVVSGDLSAMVEATLAQMMEAFSSSRIADFDPYDSDDEDQAELESEAVQWFVMGRENGFLELTAAIKEILLLRNGVIMVDAEEKTVRRTKTFRNVEVEAYAELIANPDVVADKFNEDTGDLTLTLETTGMDFKLQSVSLENFLYHSEWHKPTLPGIPVCAVRHITTRAELIGMNINKTKVDSLTAHQHDLKSESQARNPRHNTKHNKAMDESQELVEWYDVFVREQASSGADELRRIRFSYQDDVILEDSPAPFINLAAGTAILNPHRFTGISLYDKLKQSQDIRTALKRALLDNINATTKHRLAAFDGVVNDDDIADGRVNNVMRVKQVVPSVGDAVMPLAVPDTSGNILNNLESTAKERSEMGGAALDMQSAQMQIGGDRMGSQGLEKAYSVSEQLTAAMLKTVAATLIRSLFLVAHATLREYFDQPVPIKRNGKWQHVNPSDWPERRSVTIKPGMSPGERARRVNAMTQVIDSQLMLADKGMDEVLVDIHGFNRALMDWARLAEVQNPEQYYLDPDSQESQAALKSKQKASEEQKLQKAALMQQSFGLEQVRTSFEKYRQDTDLQFKYFDSVLRAEVDEAKIVGGVTGDLVKQQRAGHEIAGTGAATDGKSIAESDTKDPES